MSSVLLNSHALQFVQPSACSDVEMSDRVETDHSNNSLVEFNVNNSHQLFAQMESEECIRRVGVITSFLSLMEIAPAKALYLIREASNDSTSQEFRDYILFKQIFSDIVRCREFKKLDTAQRMSRTSSSNQQSVIGPNIRQLDSLQWMFSFFSMYAVPFHYKNTNDVENTTLYARENSDIALGNVFAVVLLQSKDTQISDSIKAILNEFDKSQTNTRMGIIVNGSSLSVLLIDNDATRTVIAQQTYNITDVSDFARLVTVLETYLSVYQNVETVVKKIAKQFQPRDEIVDANIRDEIVDADEIVNADEIIDADEIVNADEIVDADVNVSDEILVQDEDMESSPVPKTFASFDEKEHFYLDRFNTTLSFLNLYNAFGSVPSSQFCVKKRSHFCEWERNVLQKLKAHPYIIRELELEDSGNLDMSNTMLFEPARPLNKRLFSLLPTDSQGELMLVTQQILNTRFEILRQFIKQALHSIVYCHNNGIAHNNILSRGGSFFLDEQYKLKLLGFEHSVVNCDSQVMFRDMQHLAVVFAELMFNVQFDVSGDDDLNDWSAVWQEIEYQIKLHDSIIENCAHTTPSDQLLYKVNTKTKKHMFDLLKKMFHTNHDEYYHDFMYHSFVGMASSVYKEKSKQKLREKTVQTLNGNKINAAKKDTKIACMLKEKWANRRNSSRSPCDTVAVQE
jgi:serine/threonine protein kinase